MQKMQRILSWSAECRREFSCFVEVCGGVPPPPEDMSPEMVVVMSKLLSLTVVGGTYGDSMVQERIEYGNNVVRNANLQNMHPFFARANIDDNDLYIFQYAANMYYRFLVEQPGFFRAARQVADDIHKIQSAPKRQRRKASVATRAEDARHRLRLKVCKASARATSYRLLWQSAIRRTIKMNRWNREQTAKNVVERMRREKRRAMASAAKAARVEAPLSAKGASRPAAKSCTLRVETPTAADKAKREAEKCASLRMCEAHALHQKSLQDLRIAQNERRLEALSIASSIQKGE